MLLQWHNEKLTTAKQALQELVAELRESRTALTQQFGRGEESLKGRDLLTEQITQAETAQALIQNLLEWDQ